MHDPEFKAMGTGDMALSGLDAETRKRVTNWGLAKMEGSTGCKKTRKPK